jgi:hypothetical protein
MSLKSILLLATGLYHMFFLHAISFSLVENIYSIKDISISGGLNYIVICKLACFTYLNL